jgi:hypothetical protein
VISRCGLAAAERNCHGLELGERGLCDGTPRRTHRSPEVQIAPAQLPLDKRCEVQRTEEGPVLTTSWAFFVLAAVDRYELVLAAQVRTASACQGDELAPTLAKSGSATLRVAPSP